jgi:hypothetical protein
MDPGVTVTVPFLIAVLLFLCRIVADLVTSVAGLQRSPAGLRTRVGSGGQASAPSITFSLQPISATDLTMTLKRSS